jgi:predicted amidohydrolase YtcJ
MVLANSVALSRAGITAATPDPDGGLIEREAGTREPTGIMKDSAINLVLAAVPPPTIAELKDAVLRALRESARYGITSIQDISAPEHIPVFEALERQGLLTCRIYARLPLAGYRNLVDRGIRAGNGSDVLRLGSVKAFADGSLGSGTAWFFEPFEDEPHNTGLAMDVLTDGRLRTWAREADRNGLQLSIHAIGDRAVHEVLSIFEEIVSVNPPWDRRFRMEHAQHVREQDIRRFADLGVVVSAQPYHAVDDGVWAERRIGYARARHAFPFRSYLNNGVRVCFGSDWTVAPLNALAGIHAAVTRRTRDGKHPDGWIPEERVTVTQAVAAYTITAAYAAFEEKEKGTIEAGKLADMVVLSDDLFSCEPDALSGIRVDMTVWNGRIIWEHP